MEQNAVTKLGEALMIGKSDASYHFARHHIPTAPHLDVLSPTENLKQCPAATVFKRSVPIDNYAVVIGKNSDPGVRERQWSDKLQKSRLTHRPRLKGIDIPDDYIGK
jgi:hypothetical protein